MAVISGAANVISLLLTIISLVCPRWVQTGLEDIVTKNETKYWLLNQTAQLPQQNPYCLICCMDVLQKTIGKKCGLHTMCRYQTSNVGPGCKGYVLVEFTSDEQLAILDAHNTLRNIVASGLERRGAPGPQYSASNMRMLQWDSELALIAERWAAQCIFANDLCRDTKRYPVGQNIARGNFATNNDLSFVKEWYDAVEIFKKSDIFQYKTYQNELKSIAQYTQLVWADTYQVGCARVVFQKTQGSSVFYIEHFICNYGPAGNLPGQAVYKTGDPCSACPDGTGCTIDYPGLCGSEALYDLNFWERKRPTSPTTKNDWQHHYYNSCHRTTLFTTQFYTYIVVSLLYLSFD